MELLEERERDLGAVLTTAKILAVDDEPANLAVLDRVLSQAGYRDRTLVDDPRTVLGLLRATDYDLILLDLNMPQLDGMAVLRQIGDFAAHINYLPVLVLSVEPDPARKRLARTCGAHDFLEKPFDADDVLLRIHNLLETRYLHLRLQRQNDELDAVVAERTAALSESIEQLLVSDAQRRLLLNNLVNAQEEERRRIASDVHDDSIQVMAAAGMRVGMLRRHETNPATVAELTKLQSAIEQSISRLRQLLFQLHPSSLERVGLALALEEFLTHWAADAGVEWTFSSTVEHEPEPEPRIVLFRIAEEALTNVRKHARAAHVTVSVEELEPGVLLTASDDGVGFSTAVPAPAGHVGLVSMVERAELAGGWCRFDSGPGGTTVRAWVPIVE